MVISLHEVVMETLLEAVSRPIQYEIDKHGQSYRSTTVEDRINSMQPYEILELISQAFEEIRLR